MLCVCIYIRQRNREKEFERERKKKTCFVIPQFVSGASRFLMVVLYHFDVVKHIKIPGFLHISGISYKKFFFPTFDSHLFTVSRICVSIK